MIADSKPDFTLEAAAHRRMKQKDEAVSCQVIGIDEAGRGPWAGPVVAAACVIGPGHLAALPGGIDDSKRLSSKRRHEIYDRLQVLAETPEKFAFEVASIEAAEIDRRGILTATFDAMQNAASALIRKTPRGQAMTMLIDGNLTPPLIIDSEDVEIMAVVKGDQCSLSIAAAGIIAKVTRDAMMVLLDADHPAYGWVKNKGYGTATHRHAIDRFGITPQHRRSFKPIAAAAYTR